MIQSTANLAELDLPVCVVTFESLTGKSGRMVEHVTLPPGDPRRTDLGLLVEEFKLKRNWPGRVACVVDGLAVEDPKGKPIGLFQTVTLAPAPGEIGTVILIGLAVASAAASAYLASRVKAPRLSANSADSKRRYGFGRVSSDAFVGDVIPVQYGYRPRVGGKVIAKIPRESVDGSGDSKLSLLLCLGHGRLEEIAGHTADFDRLDAAGLTGLWLNDQPVANFQGCVVSARMGATSQAVIPGFADTETLREVAVGGADLRNTSGSEYTGGSASGEAVTFTGVSSVNALVARIRFPQGLYTVADSGQVDARSVKYRYRTRLSPAGSWSAWTVIEINRADQTEFFSSPRTGTLNGGTAAVHDVQVERVSVESSSATVIDRMLLDSVVEVLYSSNTYNGFAMLALELTAGDQLTGVPRVSVELKGRRVRVWDGVSAVTAPVFTTTYSANPAYLALDLITNATFGMGAAYGDANIDFPSLIAWAQYCDETVARPAAGTRARFRGNLALEEDRDGYEWLRTVCRIGNCTPATVGGVWRFVVDRVQSAAVEVFTDGDIAVDGDGVAEFSYRRELGTGGVVRPNRLVAGYENENDAGQGDTLGFPDYGESWLATEPVQEESVRLEGETDPDQVAAKLVYLMARQRSLTRTVKFKTVRPVVAVQPGDRFDLAKSLVGWGTASGRLKAGATASTFKLDRSVTLGSGTYAVRVVHQDNSVEVKTITTVSGTYPAGTALAISGSWAQTPVEWEEYALGVSGVEVKPFLCTAVRPVESKELRWEIEGVEYAAGVYDGTGDEVTFPPYSSLTTGLTPPGPVLGLIGYERVTTRGREVQLSWTQRPVDAEQTASFRIFRRLSGTEAWVTVPQPTITARGAVVEIFETDLGYDFCVVAVSFGGSFLSPYDPRAAKTVVVFGVSEDPPPVPSSLTVAPVAGNLYRVFWGEVGSPDAVEWAVLTGGAYTFPGAPPATRSGGHDCMVIGRTEAQLAEYELAAGFAHEFWVRAVGENGRMSSVNWNTAHVGVVSAALPVGESLKNSKTFNLSSEGTHSNLTYDGTNLWLAQTSTSSAGVWTSPEVDTGSLTLTRLCFRPTTRSAAADPTISAAPFSLPGIEADQWGVIDDSPHTVGLLENPYPDNAHSWGFEVRTWDGTVWSDWAAWAFGTSVRRTLRKYQVRVTLTRTKDPYRPALKGLDVVATH